MNDFREFARLASQTVTENVKKENLVDFLLLELVSEVGELADVRKRVLRGVLPWHDAREKYLDELGDVAWALGVLCSLLVDDPTRPLSHVIEKLRKRKKQGTIEDKTKRDKPISCPLPEEDLPAKDLFRLVMELSCESPYGMFLYPSQETETQKKLVKLLPKLENKIKEELPILMATFLSSTPDPGDADPLYLAGMLSLVAGNIPREWWESYRKKAIICLETYRNTRLVKDSPALSEAIRSITARVV